MRRALFALALVACGGAEAPDTPAEPALVVESPPGHTLSALEGLCGVVGTRIACTSGMTLETDHALRALLYTEAGELCGVTEDDRLWCQERGELAQGVAHAIELPSGGLAFVDRSGAVRTLEAGGREPVLVPQLTEVVMLGAPYGRLCGLSRTGRVACLDGSGPSAEVEVLPTGQVVRITSGRPLCVVRRGGELLCERPDDGQALGAMERVLGVGDVADVVSAGRGIVTLAATGEVHAFDAPPEGEDWSAGPALLSDATEIATPGDDRGCARRRSGELVCWGHWDGAREPRPVTPIAGLAGVTSVAIGASYGCAAAAGELRCWGGIDAAHLRVEPWLGSMAAPTVVDLGIPDVVDVVLRDELPMLCGRSRGGEVRCRTPEGTARPTWIPEGALVAELSLPCARVEGSGDVFCESVGAEVPVLRGTTTIATYYAQVCGARGRLVACASHGTRPGPADPFIAPTRVRQRYTPAALGPSRRLSSGPDVLCGQAPDGTWRCIGHNDVGQLGATPGRPTIEPVPFPGGPWDTLALGRRRTCGFRAGGFACAGVDLRGEPRSELLPGEGALVPLTLPGDVLDLALTETAALAVLTDGTVVGWGVEDAGNLGGGSSAWWPEAHVVSLAPAR